MTDRARLGRLIEFYRGEVAARAARPLGAPRERRLETFVSHCADSGHRSVLEIGAGAGRDARVLAASGLAYTGIDVTPAAVEHCCELGLHTIVASATDLPFADAAFDACWTMSTLMHLTDEEVDLALNEIRRVVRPGGTIEVGVWGHVDDQEHTDEHGRYFRHRSDENLLALLRLVGDVVAFDTWDHLPDGGRYQWVRIMRQPISNPHS